MGDGFIGRHIQRSNRNLLLANLCLLLALLAAGGFFWPYLYNFARGPFLMNRQSLLAAAVQCRLQKYFVTLQVDKTFETGMALYQTGAGSPKPRPTDPVKAYYLAALVGDRLLLIKSPQPTRQTKFTGALGTLPAQERTQVLANLIAKNPSLRDAFLPCMLDAGNFRAGGYWGLGLGIPLLLLAAWNLRRALAREADPSLHPIFKSLAAYGPPQTVAMDIASEVSAEAGAPTPGRVLLTRSWLLHPQPWGLDIRRLEDLAWEYKKVIRHYHSFLPTGKTYAAVIWDKTGRSLEVSCKEAEAEAILQGVQRRVPWVVAGYSKEIAQLWRKQRAHFLQTVEKRCAACRAQGNQPQAEQPQPVSV